MPPGRSLLSYKLLLAAVVAAVVAASIAAVLVGRSEHATADRLEAQRVERVRQINQINRAQCASLRNLYAVIQQTLVESDKRIDTIAYYKLHPAERQDAHKQNLLIIGRFRRPPCPEDIRLPVHSPGKG